MNISPVESALKAAIEELYHIRDIDLEITVPEVQFGDCATNVAFRLSREVKRTPREIAEEIAVKLTSPAIMKAQAINGFINISLSDSALLSALDAPFARPYADKTVVAEYSDPNPFKVLHAGHLYTTLVGDAVANLIETGGATVHRVNFGGDVGLHVGRAMWAIVRYLGGEHPEKLGEVDKATRLEWVSERYVEGTAAYESDEHAKAEIIETNKRVYDIHAHNDHESPFAQLYWTCRAWSYDGFDNLYKQLQVHPFDKYYPESETTPAGVATVQEGLEKGIFEHSDGAVVYKGEKAGLHTRVFLNSNGLPTYEAKDLGLAQCKWNDYHFDMSVYITGNDIIEYLKVVMAALSEFNPDLAGRTRHLMHGMIKLAGGAKMSSRSGKILRAEDVLTEATEANKEQSGKDQPEVVLAAVKYAFLRQRIGGDIVYEPAESVSLTGNSGPYLQYAHARARSILAKANATKVEVTELQPGERTLVRQLALFNPAVSQAITELLPHIICTYLYELSQEFNRFYEANQVIGDEREGIRLALVERYADILKHGLDILGIAAPERI